MRFHGPLNAVALATMIPCIAASAPALPPERPPPGPTIVDLNRKGEVVLIGQKTISDPTEVKKLLVGEVIRQEKAAKMNRSAPFPSLVIRASEDIMYRRVHEVMELAKLAGFMRMTLEPAGRGK